MGVIKYKLITFMYYTNVFKFKSAEIKYYKIKQ